jgi:hypothetical protein
VYVLFVSSVKHPSRWPTHFNGQSIHFIL